MAKLVRVYEPGEDRQIHFRLREHQAPGLLRFLATLPFGVEGAFWRGLAQLWVDQHGSSPDVDEQLRLVLEAGGVDRTAPIAVRKPRGRAAQTRTARTTENRFTRELHREAPALVVPPPPPTAVPHPAQVAALPPAPPAQAQPTVLAHDDGADEMSLRLLDEFDGFAG